MKTNQQHLAMDLSRSKTSSCSRTFWTTATAVLLLVVVVVDWYHLWYSWASSRAATPTTVLQEGLSHQRCLILI